MANAKKKYSVVMPQDLYDKVKALQERDGLVMNTIFLNSLQYGFDKLYGDQQVITAKPTSTTNGTKTIEIPADIVQEAKVAVHDIDQAIDGQLYRWLLDGKSVDTSYRHVLNQSPDIPQLNGNTKPKEVKMTLWQRVRNRH